MPAHVAAASPATMLCLGLLHPFSGLRRLMISDFNWRLAVQCFARISLWVPESISRVWLRSGDLTVETVHDARTTIRRVTRTREQLGNSSGKWAAQRSARAFVPMQWT